MGIIADRIRKAILGGDVRDSIADGIEVLEKLREDYDRQVINAGNSNSEIVDARGNFTKLKERLDTEQEKISKQFADMTDYLNYMPVNGGTFESFDGSENDNVIIDGGTY